MASRSSALEACSKALREELLVSVELEGWCAVNVDEDAA